MILHDTSVLIDFFNQRLDAASAERIWNQLSVKKIAITWIVWAEVYCGIRNKREEKALNDFAKACKFYDFDTDCWLETARVARICQRSGANVPLSDIQIQACANRHKLELVHNDKHFDLIQESIRRASLKN